MQWRYCSLALSHWYMIWVWLCRLTQARTLFLCGVAMLAAAEYCMRLWWCSYFITWGTVIRSGSQNIQQRLRVAFRHDCRIAVVIMEIQEAQRNTGFDINTLAPGRHGFNSSALGDVVVILSGISEHMLCITFVSNCEIALRWMPQNTFHDKSMLLQMMALFRQATSHYLSQCSPSSVSPYMASLGHTELTHWGFNKYSCYY